MGAENGISSGHVAGGGPVTARLGCEPAVKGAAGEDRLRRHNRQCSAREYGVPFRKLFISYLPVLFLRKLYCLEAGQFAQIPLKYAALQRLFKCRISKVLAGTPCDRGLPGAISKCY